MSNPVDTDLGRRRLALIRTALESAFTSKSRMQCSDIEFRFEGKVIKLSGFTQPFEFDVGIK